MSDQLPQADENNIPLTDEEPSSKTDEELNDSEAPLTTTEEEQSTTDAKSESAVLSSEGKPTETATEDDEEQSSTEKGVSVLEDDIPDLSFIEDDYVTSASTAREKETTSGSTTSVSVAVESTTQPSDTETERQDDEKEALSGFDQREKESITTEEIAQPEDEDEKVEEKEEKAGEEEMVGEERKKVEEKIPSVSELLAQYISPTKIEVPEETDTEIEVHEKIESKLSFEIGDDELPEIRGLAELEQMESESDESLAEPSTYSMDPALTRILNVRPSVSSRSKSFDSRKKSVISTDFQRKRVGFGADIKDEKEKKQKSPEMSRQESFEVHGKLTNELLFLRVKNRFLQRKLADNFKKRKMEHVLKETGEISPETEAKYQRRLEQLDELKSTSETETQTIQAKLERLEEKIRVRSAELTAIFNKLISKEKEIGSGLISTKTGKEIPPEVIEKLIKRQVSSMKQISDLRLNYILKRNLLAEKTEELKALDNVGEGLSIVDFEQLKIENRAYADKMEEKEEELSKLRVKCRNTVQIMAHIREKSAALDADIEVIREDYDEILSDYIDIRERLNDYKTERDTIRNKTMKLKAVSGLLTKPKLLMDMETSIEEAKIYENALIKLKEEYKIKTEKIRNLRKNIAIEIMWSKKTKKESKPKESAPSTKTVSCRPTLIEPLLPVDFVQKLKSIVDVKKESQK